MTSQLRYLLNFLVRSDATIVNYMLNLILGFVVFMAICSGAKGDDTGRAHGTREVGKNEAYAVVIAREGDSYESLSRQYLGNSSAAWQVRKINEGLRIAPGQIVVVPRRISNQGGLTDNSYQVVPILTYHRFGSKKTSMSVTPERFRQQLTYLRDNNYRVIRLSSLVAFLNGKMPLPPRSVVITIDDGYKSTYKVAFPLLLEFGYPATVFAYSDYLNRGGLNTRQLRELQQSGLIDFQPHSKTHDNMSVIKEDENPEDYRKRIRAELVTPKKKIKKLLNSPSYAFAFPYGATNADVLKLISEEDYQIAVTVERGGNPFFAHPLLLKRTMIFHEDSIEDFAKGLVVRENY